MIVREYAKPPERRKEFLSCVKPQLARQRSSSPCCKDDTHKSEAFGSGRKRPSPREGEVGVRVPGGVGGSKLQEG